MSILYSKNLFSVKGNNMITIERELNINDALKRVQNDFQEFNLKPHISFIGNHYKTIKVLAIDHEENIASGGIGKGKLEFALVGGMFETLEHYCCDHFFEQKNCTKAPTSILKKFTQLNKERAIQIIMEDHENSIVCKKYKNISGDQELIYPLCLTNPGYINSKKILNDDFNYKIISRYCSNSGTAIGSSYLEALIHATNECIERDAFSLLLTKHYYLNKSSKVYSINKKSLPKYLFNLIHKTEKEIDSCIYLLDITSDIKIPTILAVTENYNMLIPVYGLGTSLNSEYAIIRAVTELLQIFHVSKYFLSKKEDDDIYSNYGFNEIQSRIQKGINIQKNFPKLYGAFEFNAQHILRKIVNVNFNNIPSFYTNNLFTYFERMYDFVQTSGHDIYVSEQFNFKSGTSVVTTLIPGLEKFYIISHGNLVLPSERGIQCASN